MDRASRFALALPIPNVQATILNQLNLYTKLLLHSVIIGNVVSIAKLGGFVGTEVCTERYMHINFSAYKSPNYMYIHVHSIIANLYYRDRGILKWQHVRNVKKCVCDTYMKHCPAI